MPKHQGIQGQQWNQCQRCSFEWVQGAFTLQQGLMICPRCIDNLDVEQRPMMIGSILQDWQETENEVEVLTESLDTLEF